MTETLRNIHLHGSLGDEFGHMHRLAVSSPAEAIRALSCQHRNFRKTIEAGNWRVVRGDAVSVDERELTLSLGSQSLHIVPVVEGAGDTLGSVGKIVAGLALAAGAFFFFPSIPLIGAVATNLGIGIGLSIAAGGMSSLITPKPQSSNGRGGVNERTSFIFQGAQNVSVQGACVPLVYGRYRVGSVVVSAGLAAEQMTT